MICNASMNLCCLLHTSTQRQNETALHTEYLLLVSLQLGSRFQG